MDEPVKWKQVLGKLGKYKYPLLILVLGVILMLLPEKTAAPQPEPTSVSLQPVVSFSEQLETILSQIQGAGKVRVLLSQETGERILYQTDTRTDTSTDSSSVTVDTVIVSAGSGQQTGLIVQTDAQTYRGAIVLCQGADDPQIKLNITYAVSRATGLSTDKITVLKLKD